MKIKNISKCMSTGNNSILIRKYIERRMYSEEGYYGNKNNNPIGRLDTPLDFKNMRGIADYVNEINDKYTKSTWLTCSELLRPYFGYAIASKIITDHKNNNKDKNIKILEIGCGAGGTIDSILDYLKKFNIRYYRDIEYVAYEPNIYLADITNSLLKENHSELFKNKKLRIINSNFYKTNLFNENDIIYVLALNLVNSLPHDKVVIPKNYNEDLINSYNQDKFNYLSFKNFFFNIESKIKETHVIENNKQNNQVYLTLSDLKLKEILSYYLIPKDIQDKLIGKDFVDIDNQSYYKKDDRTFKLMKLLRNKFFAGDFVWLPTTILDLFQSLNVTYPNHKIILLDYDYIPNNLIGKDYKGLNPPVVYSIKENSLDSITHGSIFTEYKNPINIYHEIDFQFLRFLYMMITKKNTNLLKFNQFMNEYTFNEWCDTLSGFNPLLQTHKNLTFMCSQ
jgi:hypothetical protein